MLCPVFFLCGKLIYGRSFGQVPLYKLDYIVQPCSGANCGSYRNVVVGVLTVSAEEMPRLPVGVSRPAGAIEASSWGF